MIFTLDTESGFRDVVVVTGSYGLGEFVVQGIAIMAARERLSFESEITSDCAPLAGLVGALIEAGIEVHCLRDLTRGGLASALVEIAEAARVKISIDEIAIPVREDVRGACGILGLCSQASNCRESVEAALLFGLSDWPERVQSRPIPRVRPLRPATGRH